MLRTKLSVAAALLVLLPSAFAQTTSDELRRLVAAAMPPVIGKDNTELAKKLQSIKIDGAISKNFDSAKVAKALFGRNQPSEAADCRTTTTAAKEADEGLCHLTFGQRDDPTGAFTMLAFSKNIGQGRIKFIKRPAFKLDGTPSLTPVKLTDAEAYQQALKFVDLLGVPRSEIPVPPAGAKIPFPVRSLGMGAANEAGAKSQIAIMKVVSLQRAFEVPGGIFKDANGNALTHLLAPGGATVAIDDTGVQIAQVDGWSDAQMDPKLDPRLAKSVDQLVSEIADDLHQEGIDKVGTLSILIGLRKAYPNPEDPNPPLCPVCGVLRPSLKVIVSQAGAGSLPVGQAEAVTPGLVREYDLVEQTEVEAPAR